MRSIIKNKVTDTSETQTHILWSYFHKAQGSGECMRSHMKWTSVHHPNTKVVSKKRLAVSFGSVNVVTFLLCPQEAQEKRDCYSVIRSAARRYRADRHSASV